MYCAIIGDIVDSREIKERSILQEKYKDVFKKINVKYKSDIAAYFKVRDGDGFHGLLKSPKNLAEIMVMIRLAIAPNQIRIGVGIGDITTKIEANDVQNIDGSAYVIARDGIDRISVGNKKYEAIYSNTMLKLDYNLLNNIKNLQTLKTYENLINTVLCARSLIEREWDSLAAEIILLKRMDKTQREIAEELDITQSAVSKRLVSSEYYIYKYYNENLQSAINELWEGI